MSEKQPSLEVIAPTVEEAVAQGLQELGLDESAVDIEVLDEGARGLFGLGSRQARVRLKLKDTPASSTEMPSVEEMIDEVLDIESESFEDELEEFEQAQELLEEDQALVVARDTVSELIERMHVRAEVTAYYSEPDESQSRRAICVDIQGSDLSILIGPRAETLGALQYIASMIINKELGHSVPIVIDVQGYRKRREQEVRRLARRMAEQALRTGRRQMLEPMPANERRLVHLELRDNPQVTTQSVGEEPRRKVTIIPVK